MKKILATLLTITMLLTTLSTCVLPVSATEAAASAIPEGATLIFYEDFESGYADTNLLAEGNAAITKDEKTVLEITAPGEGTAGTDYYAKVVDGTANGFTGNMLELFNTSTSKYMYVYFYLNNKEQVDFTSESSEYYGKQLVLEYDTYVSNYKEADFMRLNSSVNSIGPF